METHNSDLDAFFRNSLMIWGKKVERPLPWKNEKDPYKIWLSEIILQQTRAEQGLPYYEAFVHQYPTVTALAAAPEDALLKLWEGLGYYARARNLHAAAHTIVTQYKGEFPSTYESIRALKGVGDYTAAAIASFAYGLPYSVVDGNVYRVLARFFGITLPIDVAANKKAFATLAQQLLDKAYPAAYNQAIMDFGALHCTPQRPQCATCPLAAHCAAFNLQKTAELPVKSKKLTKRERNFVYWVFNQGEQVYLHKRMEKDIWQHLHTFPASEVDRFPNDRAELQRALLQFTGMPTLEGLTIQELSPISRQVLTHQTVYAVFCEVDLDLLRHYTFLENCIAIQRNLLKKKFAFPRVIDRYIDNKTLTLGLI